MISARSVHLEGLLPHLLYEPRDQTEKPPLVLFLHGSGERGDGQDELERVKTYGLPHIFETHNPFSEPVLLIAPQCPEKTRWTDHLEALNALLDDATKRYSVNLSRIYLTGLSLGGQGVWYLAAAHPERFAALVPVCGRSNPDEACKLKDIPIWTFHGAKDDRVPPDESTEMVEAVNACGGQARLTLYPDIGHISWDEAYNTLELYTWLLKQSGASK